MSDLSTGIRRYPAPAWLLENKTWTLLLGAHSPAGKAAPSHAHGAHREAQGHWRVSGKAFRRWWGQSWVLKRKRDFQKSSDEQRGRYQELQENTGGGEEGRRRDSSLQPAQGFLEENSQVDIGERSRWKVWAMWQFELHPEQR